MERMDDETFERLYSEHAGPLLSFLALRTGNRTQGEDLLADTFERVLLARSRFDPRRGSGKAWLYTIALNLARDQGRRERTERDAIAAVLEEHRVNGDSNGAVSISDVEAVEQRLTLEQAMRGLTPEEREALALRFGADLTVPQIARLIGEPLTTAEGRVYRGLHKLRVELQQVANQELGRPAV